MAIGTEVKVGFNADEVKKGFTGIKGMFAGAARSFGKGAMMMAGAVGGKTLIDLGMRLATGTKDLAEYSGGMEDIALQTGSTVAEIVKFDRALQMAGANIDAGRVLSTLSNKIFDATHGAQDLQEAFAKAGVSAYELQGMKPMNQFMAIMKGLQGFTGGMEELNQITSEIFGGKMGMQTIRLFKNEDVMSQFGDDVAIFSERLNENAANLGGYADQLERLPYVWRSFNLAVARILGANGEGLKVMIDRLLELLNAEDLSKMVYKIQSEFAKAVEVIAGSDMFKGLSETFKQMGRDIGEGFKESVNIKSLLLGSARPAGDKSMAQLINETQMTNNLLQQIERSNNRYA